MAAIEALSCGVLSCGDIKLAAQPVDHKLAAGISEGYTCPGLSMRPSAEVLLLQLQADLAARYRVERELRTGGMATVYLARDLQYNRPVAIKLLRPELAAAIEPRFLQEIEFAARLNHPHIVPLYDSGKAAGSLFYVMPYIPDESLEERLRRTGQLSIGDALRITREVADALAHAHASNIVHRDIKPGNILLSAGHAVVSDFGIARAVSVGSQAISSEGLVIGTPAYMSPEQATGKPSGIDGRSDIYSLSCVLYEMLAGTPPFSAATPQALFARHQFDPVPSLRTVRPNVPKHVEEAVMRGLAKLPADRYPTANAFKAALGKHRKYGAQPLKTVRIARGLLLGLILIGVSLIGAALLRQRALNRPSLLDARRVVVYPLTLAADPGAPHLGEDVAAALVATLNSTKLLSGINGWRLLGEERRTSMRPPMHAARKLALDSKSKFYVDGQIILGDSTRAVVELHDVAGDSTLQTTVTFRSTDDAWTMGQTLARELLPLLLSPDEAIDLRALGSPNATATAAYLYGDRAYRRGNFRQASIYFGRAVGADSSFAIAAVMSAQAAGWSRQNEKALELVKVALAHRKALADKYSHHLQGLSAFWLGSADSAVVHFRRAIALDPAWPEAWAALGEVYSHGLPNEPAADSLQADSFQHARLLYPTFVPALYHLVEIALRRGDVNQAERLIAAMDSVGADMDLFAPVMMLRCVRTGPESIDWKQEVHSHPADVADVGSAFAGSGLRQPRCSEAALTASLQHDPTTEPSGLQRRYRALVGLHALLIAESRYQEAEELLRREARLPRIRVWPLQIVANLAGVPGESVAKLAADSLARLVKKGSSQAGVLWALALWEHHRGNTRNVTSLRDRAAEATRDLQSTRVDTLVANALEGWAALSQGDTVRAIRIFRTLAPLNGDDHLSSLCAERMLLAKLYFARREYVDAFRAASLVDAPAAVSCIIHLPKSLRIRARAAGQINDTDLLAHTERRLNLLKYVGQQRN